MHTTLFVLLLALGATSGQRNNYCMYVWTNSWDNSTGTCTNSHLQAWTKQPPCFSHSWDTSARRQRLWDLTNRPGREIADIYVSGVNTPLSSGYSNNNCSATGISTIKDMLREGHTQVTSLRIWGLFADSDQAVSENTRVKFIVWYNDNCAGSTNEKFDGVAVNNEAWNSVKSMSMADQTNYLTALGVIKSEAAKQVSGTLLTHFSLGWGWSGYSSHTYMVYNGINATVNNHMIDMFDSVDIQVAWYTASTMGSRARHGGYDYAVQTGKDTCVLAYLNPTSPCQISFFPETNCTSGLHTEADLFTQFDALPQHNINRGGFHYFQGVYGSGVPGWPEYVSTAASSAPVSTQATATPASGSTQTSTSSPGSLQTTTSSNAPTLHVISNLMLFTLSCVVAIISI